MISPVGTEIPNHINSNFLFSKVKSNLFIKDFILLTFSIFFTFICLGQAIWTNPITGTNPNTANPYITGDVNDPNLSVSGIGRGTGISGTNANDRYNANSWDTPSIDITAYFEFTLTPNVGCQINFASFIYTGQASGTGPTSFAFRSSVDGYTSNIGSPTAVGATIDLSAVQFQNISTPITFRIYGWNASASAGTFSINDFTFNGSTSCGAPITITTGAVTTSPFAVDCITSAAGSVAFTSTGTFNVGNVFTAQLSNAAGSFASPTNIGTISGAPAEGVNPGGSISITIPAAIPTGAGYVIRVVSSNPVATGTSSAAFTINYTNNCSLTSSNVTGGPFSVDCSTTDAGTIDYTYYGFANAGNVYTVQLSNASGSFASPTNIGTLASTATTGTINFTIPTGTPSGSGYRIRVRASNTLLTGTNNGIDLTITLTGGPCLLTQPYMTSVIINSCNPTCDEGNNEIVFGSTGDYSVVANAANIILRYGSGPSPTTTYTDAFVTVPATTANINTAAGCTVVQEGLGATMPPNSNFVIVRSTLCVDALSWSSLCGYGPLYILYSTDVSWNTSGNFVNSPSGMRYFATDITTTSSLVSSVEYNYNSNLLNNSDGEFVTYGPPGGSPLQYGDDNCVLNPVLLPTELISFTGQYKNSTSELFWQTASEQNNSHFTVSHSTTGKQFTNIGTVTGAGNSEQLINYRFVHTSPHPGMNYYKLHSTDYDGKTYYKGIVAIEADFSFSYYDYTSSTIELYYESDIEIYTMDGKLIQTAMNATSVPFNKSGLFFIIDKRSGITERLFAP